MLHFYYINEFKALNDWWKCEGVTQLIQKKISKQVSEIVSEFFTDNALTKLP